MIGIHITVIISVLLLIRLAFPRKFGNVPIKCGNLLLEDITEEAKNTHLDFPIPLSVISSIILGSSIIDQSVIDDVTKIVKEKLDDSVTIVQVRS